MQATQSAALNSLARASLYGRAPVIHDLEFAYGLWGYLDPPPADAPWPAGDGPVIGFVGRIAGGVVGMAEEKLLQQEEDLQVFLEYVQTPGSERPELTELVTGVRAAVAIGAAW